MTGNGVGPSGAVGTEGAAEGPGAVTSPESMPPERTAEAALRPRRLEEIGRAHV